MKQILAIIGSPRAGETLKAVRRLEAEMKALGDVEVQIVMLGEVALRDCTGCHNCIMFGREKCREAEKVKELQDRMMSADAVIFASPTYNQNVTAIMKKFLDYFTFLWHRPAMFGVRFFGLATGGGMFKDVFKTMKDNVLSWGGVWAGSLGVPHYEALTPKYRKKLDKDIAKKAALLLKAASDKTLPRPTLGRLMFFRMWRINASLAFSKEDKKYWEGKGWLDGKCRYYYGARINPVKNAVAAILMGFARRIMRGIYVGY